MPKDILYTRLTEKWYNMHHAVILYHFSVSDSIIILGGSSTMALISCPECGHSISDKAFSCPSCGYPINIPPAIVSQPAPKRKPKRHRKLPNGSPILGSAIGYFKTYDEAYQALMVYNNASDDIKKSTVTFSDLCAAMLSNRNISMSPEHTNITFAELYELYFENKYEKSKKKLSAASKNSTKAAFNRWKRSSFFFRCHQCALETQWPKECWYDSFDDLYRIPHCCLSNDEI